MSGGSYDYVSFKITDAAETLRSRHPNEPHVLGLADLLGAIADVMHDIEWADSSDTAWTEQIDAKIRAVLPPQTETAAATVLAEKALAGLQAALSRTKVTA